MYVKASAEPINNDLASVWMLSDLTATYKHQHADDIYIYIYMLLV